MNTALASKYNESLKAFDKAIELDPLNSTIWSFKGQTLTSMATFTGNESIYNESLEALDNALQIDPKNPQAWDFKSATLMSMRRNNESVEAVDRAIENIGRYQGNQTEELSGLWLTRAVVLQQAGRMNEALLSFDKAVMIVPEYYDARMMRGRALFNLGEHNLSIEDFDAAASNTERSPSAMAHAWISKADALMKIGKYEDAKAIYDKTIELNYSADAFGTGTYYLARGWQGEGNALAKLGSYNESLQAFDKVIELRPYFVYEAWCDKGLALSEMERYDVAIDAYDRAIEATAETDSPRAWIGKGNVLDKMGKHDEAIKAYDEAIKICDRLLVLYPLNGDAWYYKGAALKALGRNSEADAAFAKADNRWFCS
ncbi:MAG: tetratricopeptide repeat protein [Methanothrix sp.]|nr:tetratricopeptide repeat protein [Methanothrix sp.]